jgi:peptide-methionine (S)-S-oxide reductase
MDHEPQSDKPPAGRETATLAGGCFWCLEAVFDELEGIEDVVSGYIGGRVAKPTYQQICNGDTGHAEAVRLVFDPAVISFRDLLEVFFVIHDPTTRNRQGNDVGTQYRSAIFFHSPGQKATAEAVMDELKRENAFAAPIVTELAPAGTFYPAEDYHQEYFRHNAYQPYCQFVVAPKLAKFREKFAARRKHR